MNQNSSLTLGLHTALQKRKAGAPVRTKLSLGLADDTHDRVIDSDLNRAGTKRG
jgi:hypothetical protein